jgi:TRAP transporter TAXI family solute receptor
VPADDYNRQLELYRSGQVDALWQFMGIPSGAIQAAQDSRPLRALALPAGLIAELGEGDWRAAELPVGAYGAVERPVPTIAMGTSLGFQASLPDEIAYAITSVICAQPERVRTIHPAAAQFDPRQAPLQPGGPLHPGAERYYREQGWL